MSESFRSALGRKVVSRASAEEVGALNRLVVDITARQVALLVLGKGRRVKVVGWDQVSGFGPDAVMVASDDAAHEPVDEAERKGADGRFELLGKRVLTDMGNEIGTVEDVLFDPETGGLEQLIVGEGRYPAASLLGGGSYAIILDASVEETAARV